MVSGALSSLGTTPQQILSVAGGIIVVSIADDPASGSVVTLHNSSSTALAGVVDMGDGSTTAFTMKPGGDELLPAVQDGSAAEIRVQIFPGGAFTAVTSILIGLTPNPAAQQAPEAVAQAFTGGV